MNGVSVAEKTVGNTPIVRLQRIEEAFGLKAELYAKLEWTNPTGSSKDRAVAFMLKKAEEDGVLSKGGTVIEPTSGNTGIALAALCSVKGYKAVIVMPDNMSEERKRLMRIYGAELVLTDGKLGMKGAIAKAEELQKQIEGSFILGQFENPANAMAHYQTTGPEIDTQMGGRYEVFVAGVGTGGTFSGTAKYLKERNQTLKAVAVEPKTSAVLSGGKVGAHGLQGIGAGFVTSITDTGLIDEVVTVSDEEAVTALRKLLEIEGLFVGISSGAALWASVQIAKRDENKGKRIVTIFPDSGAKYSSIL